jgi:hypothetical protein
LNFDVLELIDLNLAHFQQNALAKNQNYVLKTLDLLEAKYTASVVEEFFDFLLYKVQLEAFKLKDHEYTEHVENQKNMLVTECNARMGISACKKY